MLATLTPSSTGRSTRPDPSPSVTKQTGTASETNGASTSLEDALNSALSPSINYTPENSPSKRSSNKRSRSVAEKSARKRPRRDKDLGESAEGGAAHEPGSWVPIKVLDEITGDQDDLIRLFVVGPTGHFIHPSSTPSSLSQYMQHIFAARRVNTRFVKKQLQNARAPAAEIQSTDEDSNVAPPLILPSSSHKKRQGWLFNALSNPKKHSVVHASDFPLTRINPACYVEDDEGVNDDDVVDDLDVDADGDTDIDIEPLPSSLPVPAARVQIAVLENNDVGAPSSSASVDQLMNDDTHPDPGREPPSRIPSAMIESAAASSRTKRTPRKPKQVPTTLTHSVSTRSVGAASSSGVATRTSARRGSAVAVKSAVTSLRRRRSARNLVLEHAVEYEDIGTQQTEGMSQAVEEIGVKEEFSGAISHDEEIVKVEDKTGGSISAALASTSTSKPKGKGNGKGKGGKTKEKKLEAESRLPPTSAFGPEFLNGDAMTGSQVLTETQRSQASLGEVTVGIHPAAPTDDHYKRLVTQNLPPSPTSTLALAPVSYTPPAPPSSSLPSNAPMAVVPQSHHQYSSDLPLSLQFQQSIPVIASLPPAMQSYLFMALANGTGPLPPVFSVAGAGISGAVDAAIGSSRSQNTAQGFGDPGPLLSMTTSQQPPVSQNGHTSTYAYAPPPPSAQYATLPPASSSSTTLPVGSTTYSTATSFYSAPPTSFFTSRAASPATNQAQGYPSPAGLSAVQRMASTPMPEPSASLGTTLGPQGFPSAPAIAGGLSPPTSLSVGGQAKGKGKSKRSTTARPKPTPKPKNVVNNAEVSPSSMEKRKGPIVKLGTKRIRKKEEEKASIPSGSGYLPPAALKNASGSGSGFDIAGGVGMTHDGVATPLEGNGTVIGGYGDVQGDGESEESQGQMNLGDYASASYGYVFDASRGSRAGGYEDFMKELGSSH
ncbi:hypothetical protein D9757_007367 [Collybiopsis confluens]|uniref:Uncharacterized protein n=1 Tax=Collybiopsis confluens TaxID=2823264 RepID=A0A8H5HIB5_9AGAR|nr:hypothetical protein D9757_007367 [Collybiopsis confluens]